MERHRRAGGGINSAANVSIHLFTVKIGFYIVVFPPSKHNADSLFKVNSNEEPRRSINTKGELALQFAIHLDFDTNKKPHHMSIKLYFLHSFDVFFYLGFSISNV